MKTVSSIEYLYRERKEPLAKVSAGFAPERSAIGLIKLINIMK